MMRNADVMGARVGQIAPASEILDAADFQLTEWLARRAGAPDDAALRAVLLGLSAECHAGGTCLPLEPAALGEALAVAGVEVLPAPASGDGPTLWVKAFATAAEQGRYAAILGRAGEVKPLIWQQERLYFQRYFHAEKNLAQGLAQRCGAAPLVCEAATARKILSEVLEEKPLRLGPEAAPLRLTTAQQWALAAALRERLLVISGGPGTGKTALATTLLRVLLRRRDVAPARLRLCAPTGLAAQRLQTALRAGRAALTEIGQGESDPDHALDQIPVETLHRLLAYHPPTGRFARHAGDPLDADLVVLDEASMADLFTLAALLDALPPEAALILVGDADQLPAVAAGAVLGELLPAPRSTCLDRAAWEWVAACFPTSAPTAPEAAGRGAVPAVVLDHSHRSGREILHLAAAINRGDAEAAERALGAPRAASNFFSAGAPPLRRLEWEEEKGKESLADLDALLDAYAETFFFTRTVAGKTYAQWLALLRIATGEAETAGLDALMALLGVTRLLSPLRHTGRGCLHLNDLLRRKLEARFDPASASPHTPGFHGAPLLIARNDPRTGLFNGEIGVWLRRDTGLIACFRRSDRWLRIPAALLPPNEPAFATTVHKSQGSEFDEVVLVLPEAGNRLLTREILYTAVTRARKVVGICGSRVALAQALEQRARRRSGLRELFAASLLPESG